MSEWVWSVGGMVLTVEQKCWWNGTDRGTEVLGERHYIVWGVGE